MQKYLLFLFLVLLILSGCKKDEVVPPPVTGQDGQIILKIDRDNAPQNVTSVTAYLTRTGYSTITNSLNLLTDSTADLTLNSIPVGLWHLKVDAEDSSGVVQYTGETDVTVIENQTIQITLTLVPVTNGVGNIYLYVTWGTSSTTWIDYPGNPVFTGINNELEPSGTPQGKVYYDDNKYKMWYTGLGYSGRGHIMYAESNDGISWFRPVNHPVLYPGNFGSWDQYSVVVGAILIENDHYKLYYGGKNSLFNGWHIGLAISQDGINWVKHPTPVLYAGVGWEQKINPWEIVKKDNDYFLFYDGLIWDSVNEPAECKIGVATSSDGINFIRSGSNPIIYPSQGWEGPSVLSASVVYETGMFTMVYNNFNSNIKGFGKATSLDGINWTKASDNPFFTAMDTYNHWASDIKYPHYRLLNGEYRIYYSAYFESQVYYKIGMIKKVE